MADEGLPQLVIASSLGNMRVSLALDSEIVSDGTHLFMSTLTACSSRPEAPP
jgi:hypothetical protein